MKYFFNKRRYVIYFASDATQIFTNVKSVACVMSKSGTKATISGKNSLKSCSYAVFYQIEAGYFNENATLWRKSGKKRCHTGFSGGCSEKVCPAPQNALQELVYIQC